MNIKKLYYGLVSLISIVVIAITLWIVISSLLKILLISNKEYLSDNKYQLNNCNYEIQRKYCSIWKNNSTCTNKLENNKIYQKDLENCKNNKKKEILTRRSYDLKLNLIWAWSTFIVFLILFLFHYLKFKKFD